MQYVLDKQFSEFAANIWKPVVTQPDPELVAPAIGSDGRLSIVSQPLLGPENENERYFPVVWNSAKPSRWFRREDFEAHVAILPNGQLAGDIGLMFRFVDADEVADNKTTFKPAWGMD